MKSASLVACLLYETADVAERVAAFLSTRGVELVSSVSEPDSVPTVATPIDILLVEDHARGDALVARARSFASLLPDTVLIVIAHESFVEQQLLDAGALDVIYASGNMERQLARSIVVARHLRKLKEQQLRLTADLAHRERLNSLGLLAASVGHEINNPCAVILTNANTMRDRLEAILMRPRFQQVNGVHDEATDWLEALGDIVGAGRRIASIVSMLGVFSRKASLDEPEVIRVNEAIAAVLRFIGKEVRHQAEIKLDLCEEPTDVLITQHAIMQILTNLVVNALQALLGVEAPVVHISTRADDASVLLEITDNGPGIPREIVGRIFDPFFTTKKVGVGTGLGLSITRELAMRVGGDVFVESAVGSGATFRVVLPLYVGTQPAAQPRSVPPQAERLRIMIVDDDDMMLRSMTRSLRDRFECIPMRSVEAALASLSRDDRIDLVVIDVVMPGRSGLDLYQELERVCPALAPRTVFLSGGIRSETLRKSLEQTGRPILRKPIDTERFVETLRRIASE